MQLTGLTKMSKAEPVELIKALSPEVLRDKITLPHEEYRETFVARFLATSSHNELVDELACFVRHVRKHWHHLTIEWPRDLARDEGRRLLRAAGGEFAAMQAVRHGDHGGLRGILDQVTKALQAEALAHYLDICILQKIEHLSFKESLALATAYRDTFRTLPGIELESPTAIVGRWKHVLYDHARVALGITPRRETFS